MTDHAATVREYLIHNPPYAESDDVAALIALNALVAELDEAREAKRGWCRLYSRDIQAAEAENARLREALRETERILDGWVLASDPGPAIVAHAENVIRAALAPKEGT